MTAEPKMPPARIARAVDAIRRRLRRAEQKLVPTPIAVLDMMTGAFFARSIYTAAKFGIADVLSDGPLTAEAIAQRVDANPEAVRRLLRTLVSRGIFAQQSDGRSHSHRSPTPCVRMCPHRCGASCCSGARATQSY